MTIAYWITAGLLAFVYFMSGGMKVVRNKEALLASGQNWVKNVNPAMPKIVGLLEVLGAVGVIVPPLVGIAVILAPAAAIGLALVQVVAIVVHVRLGETKQLAVNVVLLALAVSVAVLAFYAFTF
ncbi:unannotated protein [freshwater metagenome]|jgi:hypothetical protein|uniref:Unannotated protein n=1 Tax=freshwater metagenome TaxID=449393 RepID=A0A6J6DMW3_9ZZZZ|nr:DoxX family protein [Actinomycetota bacterium]